MTSILSSNAINYSDKSKVGTSREKPPKLYRIGEVVDYSGVSRQTIHNYTTMGLLRRIGGRQVGTGFTTNLFLSGWTRLMNLRLQTNRFRTYGNILQA